jgi:hypothetical protein
VFLNPQKYESLRSRVLCCFLFLVCLWHDVAMTSIRPRSPPGGESGFHVQEKFQVEMELGETSLPPLRRLTYGIDDEEAAHAATEDGSEVDDEPEPDDELLGGSDTEKEVDYSEEDERPIRVAVKPEPVRAVPRITMAEQIFKRFGPARKFVAFPLSGHSALALLRCVMMFCC